MIIRRKEHIYKGEYLDIANLLFSGKFQRRNYVLEFEKAFKEFIGMPFSIATSSGCYALEIILKYYKFDIGGALLIPAYTARVVKETLDRLSVRYIIVDIDPQTSNICINDLKKKATLGGTGILLTHLLGNVCSEEIELFAKSSELIIIEDCAHVHGASRNGEKAGSFGHASFFSFGFSKLMNTFCGGMILTRDESLLHYAKNFTKNDLLPTRPYIAKKIILGHIERTLSKFPINIFLKFLLRNEKNLIKIKRSIVSFYREDQKNEISRIHFSNLQAYLGIKQLKQLKIVLSSRENARHQIKNNAPKEFKFLKRNRGDVIYNLIIRTEHASKFRELAWQNGIDTGHGNSIMEPIGDIENYPGLKSALETYIQLPLHNDFSTRSLMKIISSLHKIKFKLYDSKISV